MSPFNVMASAKLNLPCFSRRDFHLTAYKFPSYAPAVQLKANNEVSINRAVLNLITVPNLRAAYVFRFKENTTYWSVYEHKHQPLEIHEARGAMVLAMQQVRQNSTSVLSPITIQSNSFITSTEEIIQHLQEISADEKIFIVLVFKEHLLVTGNYYNETDICRALLNFSPRESKKVISMVTSDVQNERPFSFVLQRYSEDKKRKEEWLLL